MQNGKLEFYTNPQSRGRIVRWMLEEVGQPYETKVIDYGDQMKSGTFLNINPMGKVPALVHEGRVVTECAAICAYLADAFPQAKLAPPPTERGAYYRWLFFAAGPLESAVTNKALGFAVPEDRERMAGYGNFEWTVKTLAQAVTESTYIAGETFTAADVYVGSHVGWGLQFKTLPERNEFIDYFAKLKTRPAYIKGNQLDDALVGEKS